jgi:hypothetical protein
MTTIKRTRDNLTEEQPAGTPNPNDRKSPRSILKGKAPEENEEETKKKEGKEKTDDKIITPPHGSHSKGLDKDEIRSKLGFTFERMNNNKESITKNNKNKSGNDEVKNTKEANEDTEAGKSKNEQEEDDEENSEQGDSAGDNENNNKQEEKDNTNNEGDNKENNEGNDEEKKDKNDNKDIDKMEEDKYCLDLHGGGYKKHTSEWQAIPEGVMKNSTKLTINNEAYIYDTIEDIADEMETKSDTMDKDKWIKLFIKTKDISAAGNKRRFIRIFEVSLACSDPK